MAADNGSSLEHGRSGILSRFLNVIEVAGNRLPDPIVLYIILAALVPLLSLCLIPLNWTKMHPGTGESVHLVNLLQPDQIQRMFTEAVDNFTSFPPLGVVLVTMMGIGVAERSGLFSALIRFVVGKSPASLVSLVVVFAGVMSSMAADAGYVVLTPLGAVVFAAIGRHPLAGLAAAFAGTAGGFSANFFLTGLDPLLSGFTLSGARLLDPEIEVSADANYYFMVVSVFLVTGLGWWVTEKIVEPRLGTWDPSRGALEDAREVVQPESQEVSSKEKRGLWMALVGLLAVVGLFLGLTVPANGVLRGEDGSLDPFIHSLDAAIMIFFIIPGLAYGLAVGTCRTSRQFAKMTGESMATMGSYIVLAFAAAQFVAYFKWSNLGLLTALTGADFLKALGIGDLPLILTFVLLAAFINLVLGSASAKWGIMAPVFVPMFMALGLSPEMTQAAYRVGDSVTNMVTPLNPYFPIILSFAARYDRKLGIGTLISSMIPYSIAFTIGWMILLTLWYLLGLPLGPGAGIHL